MKRPKDQTEFSGLFGESVTARKVNGRLVFKIRRKRNMDNPTPNQIAFKAKFREASSWASTQVENEERRAFYESKITKQRQSAYSLALKDFCKPPEVKSITPEPSKWHVGGVITIHVFDYFMVTRVTVMITDASGNMIEGGDAVVHPENKFHWKYTLTVANHTMKGAKVVATAFDRAEHTGSLEVVL